MQQYSVQESLLGLGSGLKTIQIIESQQQDGKERLDHLLRPSGQGHKAILSALCWVSKAVAGSGSAKAFHFCFPSASVL